MITYYEIRHLAVCNITAVHKTLHMVCSGWYVKFCGKKTQH